MKAISAVYSTNASSWQGNVVENNLHYDKEGVFLVPTKLQVDRDEEASDYAKVIEPKHERLNIKAEHWGSAAGDLDQPSCRAKPLKLNVVVAESATSILTDRVKVALDNLLPIVGQVAGEYFVPISLVEILGHISQDEDAEEVVIRILVVLPEAAAMTFWEFLGTAVESRTSDLPAEIVTIATERISFEVLPAKYA
jgi:hypothetical protein